MSFDLSKVNPTKQAESGAEFEVTLPTGEPTGWFIKVRGDLSPTVKNYGKRVFQEIKQKEEQAKRRGKTYDMGIEEAEDIAIKSAVVRVISWRGLEEGGKEVPFSEDKAEAVFAEHSWVRDQVMEQSQNSFLFSK